MCIATLPCETVTSENKRRLKSNAKINDKLQGTVGTHLRSGGSFNKQIKRGSLLSLPVKKLKSVNIWHIYGLKGGLCRALYSTFSSVLARRTKCSRQQRLACNFAKYSPIFIFFSLETQQ